MFDANNFQPLTAAMVKGLEIASDQWEGLIRYKSSEKGHPEDQFVRAAVARRPDCPLHILNIAADDLNQGVLAAAAQNPRATWYVFNKALSRHKDEWAPRFFACSHIGVPEGLILEHWKMLTPMDKEIIRRRKIILPRALDLIRAEERAKEDARQKAQVKTETREQ